MPLGCADLHSRCALRGRHWHYSTAHSMTQPTTFEQPTCPELVPLHTLLFHGLVVLLLLGRAVLPTRENTHSMRQAPSGLWQLLQKHSNTVAGCNQYFIVQRLCTGCSLSTHEDAAAQWQVKHGPSSRPYANKPWDPPPTRAPQGCTPHHTHLKSKPMGRRQCVGCASPHTASM